MTASHRLRLAVIAADLTGVAGGPAPHAERLGRMLAGRPRPATALAELEAAPAWLRGSVAARDGLALRAALMLTAPHLARSIDGARLRAVADAAGPEALDAAIAAGAGRDPAAAPDIAPGDLAEAGRGILAAALPAGLAALLPPGTAVDPALARAALDAAMAPS